MVNTKKSKQKVKPQPIKGRPLIAVTKDSTDSISEVLFNLNVWKNKIESNELFVFHKKVNVVHEYASETVNVALILSGFDEISEEEIEKMRPRSIELITMSGTQVYFKNEVGESQVEDVMIEIYIEKDENQLCGFEVNSMALHIIEDGEVGDLCDTEMDTCLVKVQMKESLWCFHYHEYYFQTTGHYLKEEGFPGWTEDGEVLYYFYNKAD